MYYASKAAKDDFEKEFVPYDEDYRRRDGSKPKGRGVPVEDTWNCSVNDKLHSIAIQSLAEEKVGHRTQKPVKLLERIIRASSKEGDLVFDPFAGCSTTCVAANNLNRRWIACDISELAVPVLRMRIDDEVSVEKIPANKQKRPGIKIVNPEDLVKLEDLSRHPNRKLRRFLAMQQIYRAKFRCPGCKEYLKLRHFHIDHLFPKSRFGDITENNLILLCGPCNTKKGNKTWEEWKGRPYTGMRL